MITYQSSQFSKNDISSVYIAFDAYGKILKQYEVNAQGRTVRESVVSPKQFEAEAVARAYSLHKQAFKQVRVK